MREGGEVAEGAEAEEEEAAAAADGDELGQVGEAATETRRRTGGAWTVNDVQHYEPTGDEGFPGFELPVAAGASGNA